MLIIHTLHPRVDHFYFHPPPLSLLFYSTRSSSITVDLPGGGMARARAVEPEPHLALAHDSGAARTSRRGALVLGCGTERSEARGGALVKK